ncbi:MAG: hypothetical protein JNK05_09575 [Myxococcales bacterium]|nr:hypothetical protein [Myxococcales bacterium]
MATTANLQIKRGTDAAVAVAAIATVDGVLRVTQVHPGDEDEHYARVYVVELDPDRAEKTSFALAALDEVESVELNVPRKAPKPRGRFARPG